MKDVLRPQHFGASPYAKFSSKGWKLHFAFEKGKEQEVAHALDENNLHFKVELGIGTYFQGNKESGATVYVGAHDDATTVAQYISETFSSFLTLGAYVIFPSKGNVAVGSGADILFADKVMGRFDVAKTPFGWASGNSSYKYSEKGLPSWLPCANGLPSLKKDDLAIVSLLDNWNTYSSLKRQEVYQQLSQYQDQATTELIKDFGQEFILGNN